MIILAILLWSISFFIFFNKNDVFKNDLLNSIFSFLLALSILSYTYCLILFLSISFMAFQAVFTIIPFIYLIKNRLFFTRKWQIQNVLTLKEFIIAASLILIFTILFFIYSNRWGAWDAWAIWSLHAKFLVHETQFTQLFSNLIDWTHPDYPLMLPSIIASIWKSLGNFSAIVPLILSYVITLCLILKIFTSLLHFKLNNLAIISLILLSVTNIIIPYGSLQYADTLLSVFILAPFILLSHFREEKAIFNLLLVGFFAASCGWIKNEGLVFFLIFIILFSIYNIKKPKHILYVLIGALIPLLSIVYFKLNYAPGNDLFVKSDANVLLKLLDFKRYIITIQYIIKDFMNHNSLILFILTVTILYNSKYFLSFTFKVLFLLFAVYFFVYILTPNNLEWHLQTSYSRLFHHITPVLLYSILLHFGKDDLISIHKISRSSKVRK